MTDKERAREIADEINGMSADVLTAVMLGNAEGNEAAFTLLHDVTNIIAQALAAVREECADIADQHASIEGIAQRIAQAIRSRGT